MDNFMNRLSQRFNAQEIINANTQAEAQELDRLRTQRKEYDECMQEMRRLNLKNVESAEKIRSLAEKVNTLAGRALAELDEKEKQENGQLAALQEALEEVRRDLASMQAGTERELKEQGEVLKGLTAAQTAAEAARDEAGVIQKELADMRRDAAAAQTALMEACSGGTLQKELANVHSDMGTLRELSESVLSELNRMQVKEQSAREESGTALSEMRQELDKIRAAVEEMKEAFAESGELAGEIEETLKASSAELQEFMHRESVKVYRNVQAVLLEENKNQIKTLSESIQKDKPGRKGIYALLAVILLASLGNLGVLIANILGFFA